MTVSSLGEMFSALGAGDTVRLLGTPESEWVDFKRDPYPLQTQGGRWEIAKDVAAFANARGGAIVLGMETARQSHEISDLASLIVGVRRDLIIQTSTSRQLRTTSDRL